MFERYTEAARRALFFARYETSELGSHSIEPEHLLLGLVRQPTPIVEGVLKGAGATGAHVRGDVEHLLESRPKVPTSVEIPFSAPCQRILQYTSMEADALGHGYIGTEHLLLALLREENTVPWRVLTSRGLDLATARKKVEELTATAPAEQPERTAAIHLISDALIHLDELSEEVTTARGKEIATEIRRALEHVAHLLGRL